MERICPYCGRAGELGSSCDGCGYVLQEKDKALTDRITAAALPCEEQEPPIPVAQAVIREVSFADRLPIFVRVIILLFGWIIGLPITLLGILGILGNLIYTYSNFIDAILMISFGLLFVLIGIAILRLAYLKSMKVSIWKYWKYLLLADFLFFIIVAFITS